MNNTKILCTVGPASLSMLKLTQMKKAGMSAIRINISHGDINQYKKTCAFANSLDIPVLFDTQGPELRLKNFIGKVKKGEKLEIGSKKKAKLNHSVYKDLKKGVKVHIDDGKLLMRVVENTSNSVVLKALNTHTLRENPRLNVPGIKLKLPIITKKDREAIKYAVEAKAPSSFLAVSFAQDGKDIKKIRNIAKGSNISIISKIENKAGVDNFKSILNESDGIMVARGDLGLEVPSQNVPALQKEFLRKCNTAGKIGIVATQMLESMTNNPQPTRAETSDVANAIIDGADTVMLSGETAVGKYPVEAVKEMAKIAKANERFVKRTFLRKKLKYIPDTITNSISNISSYLPLTKIVAITKSGFTARMIARFRPRIEVIALTTDKMIEKQLSLVYGVRPVYLGKIPEHGRIYKSTILLLEKKLLKKTDFVLFTAGVYTHEEEMSNLIEVHKISDILAYSKTIEHHGNFGY